MNDQKLKKLSQSLNNSYHLKPGEKALIRDTILTSMAEHPRTNQSATHRSWIIRHSSWSLSIAIALILAISLNTISYAAEPSLPGEPLYGFKVAISEPLQGVIKTSSQAQAQWNNELVEKRLNEAEILAQRNKLQDPAIEQEIVERLTNQTDKARASVETVSLKNTVVAAELNARLEAALEAHRTILSKKTPTLASNQSLTESLVLQASTTRALSLKLEQTWLTTGNKKEVSDRTEDLQQRIATQQQKNNDSRESARESDEDNDINQRLFQAQHIIAPIATSTTTSTPSALSRLQQALRLEREAEILKQHKESRDMKKSQRNRDHKED
jgi:hypothetical protein